MGKISLLTDTIASYARAAGKRSILQTKPQSFGGVSIPELKLAPKVEGDIVQLSAKTKPTELVQANNELFSWAKEKPALSFDKISPDSLVMIRMTDFYPEGGKILSSRAATLAEGKAGYARSTVHFSLNKPVTEHELGNAWDTMDYAIVMPFKEAIAGMSKSKVIGGIQDDFYVLDEIAIPKGSAIVKYNSKIPAGQFQISEAFDGVKLIETSERNLHKSTDTVIRKMGFNQYNDALQKHLGATDEEMKLLTSMPETIINETFGSIKANKGFDETIKETRDLIKQTEGFRDCLAKEDIESAIELYKQDIQLAELGKKYSEKMKTFPENWKTFCRDNDFIEGLHQGTPWFKAEMGIGAVNAFKILKKNHWGEKGKELLIKIFDEAEAALPKGKTLGMDTKGVKKIIEESETPEIALKRLEKELKIKCVPVRQPSEMPKACEGMSGIKLEEFADENIPEDLLLSMIGL